MYTISPAKIAVKNSPIPESATATFIIIPPPGIEIHPDLAKAIETQRLPYKTIMKHLDFQGEVLMEHKIIMEALEKFHPGQKFKVQLAGIDDDSQVYPMQLTLKGHTTLCKEVKKLFKTK